MRINIWGQPFNCLITVLTIQNTSPFTVSVDFAGIFPMIGLEEKFVSLLKRTLNLISSDVMFSIVNEVSDWNVEFAV